MTRLGRLIGFGEDDSPEPASSPDEMAMDEAPPAESSSIDALATALADLIVSAQRRVDGAASLITESADQARAYGDALCDNADMLDAAADPSQVTTALIEITRSMIERTRGAEERLRLMGDELKTLQRDLDDARDSAGRDPLTGLPNRRALETALTKAVESARRCDQMLSVAFCDIDHFKQLNDRHGHHVGDRVLRLVGDCLADSAGKGVLVGRQGGEEFVMLFEGVSLASATARVDAIRAELNSRTFRSRTDDAPLGQISFSAGVATLRAEEGGEDLLRRADAAMYRAKEGGRNRVEPDR